MPDFVLRGIEADVAERIKVIARERSWAINDVILHLVKQGLGMGVKTDEPVVRNGVSITALPVRDLAWSNGVLANDEDAVMRAAIEAFERLPVQAVSFS